MIPNLNIADMLPSSPVSASTFGSTNSIGAFSALFASVLKNSPGASGVNAPVLAPAIGQNTLQDPLTALKQLLQEKGISLDGNTVDPNGLDALGEIFLAGGFKPETITVLMNQWKTRLSQGSLTLKDIFSDIAKAGRSQTSPTKKSLLAVSAVPFIETILAGFGLPPQTVRRLVTSALSPKEGVDLSRLLAGLRQEQKSLPSSSFNTLDNQSAALVNRIGIGENQTGAVTMDQFIHMIERRVAQDTGAQRQGEATQRFLQHLEPASPHASASINPVAQTTEASLAVDLQKHFQLAAVGLGEHQLENVLSKGSATDKVPDPFLARGADKPAAGPLPALKRPAGDGATNFFPKSEVETPAAGPVSASKGPAAGSDSDRFLKSEVNKLAAAASSNRGTDSDVQGQTIHDIQQAFGADRPRTSDSLRKVSDTAQRFVTAVEARVPETASNAVSAGPSAAPQKMPSYVLDQVGRQILRSHLNGENEIRLQLKPPELGRLQMRIESSGQQLKVNIVTEHAATRNLLLAHSSDLKTLLQQQGIYLDRIDVQISPNFGQSMANSGQGGDSRYNQKRSENTAVEGMAANAAPFIQPTSLAPVGTGALNLVV